MFPESDIVFLLRLQAPCWVLVKVGSDMLLCIQNTGIAVGQPGDVAEKTQESLSDTEKKRDFETTSVHHIGESLRFDLVQVHLFLLC